ncbi:unnamed protein product [Eruca vesicaria subsp. sativa]|uniref:Uncharacterized protein n=1 Tax=Eruca vesicaria subsp. sativa TaxID=29727 RepID=A0ABC8ISJ7_ERUVS|nr:unnamed protein product [Eruca vesicaria subsp. sativa]
MGFLNIVLLVAMILSFNTFLLAQSQQDQDQDQDQDQPQSPPSFWEPRSPPLESGITQPPPPPPPQSSAVIIESPPPPPSPSPPPRPPPPPSPSPPPPPPPQNALASPPHSSRHRPRRLWPPPPPPPQRTFKQSEKSGLNTGKTVGLVFAGFAGLLQICVVAFLVFKRNQLLRMTHTY